MVKKPKIIFAGTPDFAAKHLQALLDLGHNIVAVYTQPDRPSGRGKKVLPSAVKQVAQAAGVPVIQPPSLRSAEAQQELAELKADLMVVVAYGLILPQAVLDIPPLGCINVHGSLLPKWRGAAPIQRAIWAGDQQTGITIMQMDQGLDTGAMLHKISIPIEAEDTSATLYEKLARIGPQALLYVLDNLHSLTPVPQNNHEATYASKLSKEEARIDWEESAEQLARNIRAFNPWPVAWAELARENVKIWAAEVLDEPATGAPGDVIRAGKEGIVVATGSHPLRLDLLQLPGKKPLAAADVVNSRKNWFIPGLPIGGQEE